MNKESQGKGLTVGIVFALIIIISSYQISNYYYFVPQDEEQIKRSEKVIELKKTNDENTQIKANSVQLEKALDDAEHSYSSLKSVIPTEAELPKILDWIASKAYERNLKLEHFSQGTQVKPLGTFSEVPVQVEVLGYYDGVERFISDFSRFERVLRVQGVKMLQEQQQAKPEPASTVRAVISFSAFVSKEKLAGLTK